ncbi:MULTISPECIES: DEAD/DEAH box helicase [Methanobacterium]|uniref:DEAD/DEAH box helicase n=1 Tax=Methanobacterium veterum TaxID=408577 RepID=A0A9E5A441_9EURY|nr:MULTISPECIES: DEAD/DEAH box helicase [Methanobacterium]MCZ3365674.1 DEAD/DEAH box helicase [Methanobacterium veterum]MCZ3371138.1 DEAD/DEAH box helicase [Methanobacterium veterum]
MSNQNPEILFETLEKFSEDYLDMRLEAQAHARSIISNLNPNKAQWPHFKKDLDIRLYYMANFQILSALNLLEFEKYQKPAKDYLKKGAEALEYLYKYPGCDSSISDEVIFNSILAYYISGNYASAYVLSKEIDGKLELSDPQKLIATFLKKDLKGALTKALNILNDRKYKDQIIANEILEGNIDENEAISRVFNYSIAKAVSLHVGYVKTGKLEYYQNSIKIIEHSINLAKKHRFVDWWWWLYSLSFIFKEYYENSLWKQLDSFKEDNKDITKKYIRSQLSHKPPVIELWPSQVSAMPMVIDEQKRSFCLKMPTSAGKTRIAELTILRFFLDSLEEPRKCVYIAPFRSLALEIEKKFRENFNLLGYKVSEIYGGFDLNPAESTLIQETHILVLTPEKFDAILRYIPDIAEDIGLIIIDEGHIIDTTKRGLMFEFFIQRLLNRFNDKDCRFLFISAVLPNAKQFAQWITGSSNQLIESDWRPSRLMLGRLTWRGESAWINYTHNLYDNFNQDCFVPNFVERTKIEGLPGAGRLKNPFPNNANEAFALSALLFARKGTTLVFVPQKRQAKPFGDLILQAIRKQRIIEKSKGKDFELPSINEKSEYFKECKRIIESEMGKGSFLLKFLKNGFVIHHAGLPSRVRIAIEDLVRANDIKLIIATTTLAEGVNLPIKTVLIKGLYIDMGKKLDSLRFWNICGRAGRAGKENEGQILFCLDETIKFDKHKRNLANINLVIHRFKTSEVVSMIYKLLYTVVREWKRKYPDVDISKLCINLANNSYTWIDEDNQNFFRVWMDILDSHLLAISEESDVKEISPSTLQEILEGSLLFIQLQQRRDAYLSIDLINEILSSRIHYIWSKYPSSNVRKRIYKLGMRLSDCELIENNREYLYNLFEESILWDELSEEKRVNLLIKISKFILQLKEIVDNRPIPKQWPQIISSWLKGKEVLNMVEDDHINTFTNDPTELRLFLEDMGGYRLPWGLTSIVNYLKMIEEDKSMDIPSICSYFSGMFKYGVNNPVAVCILPYLNQERYLALTLADICPYTIENPKKIVEWFNNLTEEQLIEKGIKKTVSRHIIQLMNDNAYNGQVFLKDLITINLTSELINLINEGDNVLLAPRLDISQNHYQILTIDGHDLGTFEYYEPIPKWWYEFQITDSIIENIQYKEGLYKVSIRIET